MKQLSFAFRTAVSFSQPIQDHFFVLRCLPKTSGAQRVNARLALSPDVPFTLQTDSFGNTMAVGCIEEEHDSLSYLVKGYATVSMKRVVAEQAHPMFRYPSELTKTSDEMRAYLAGLKLPENDTSALCTELMHALHTDLMYEPGSTTVTTTAAEAFASKKGVCQDFSHILVALLREKGLAARYVTGLAVGEGTTHAWAEAQVDGRWIGFDPTRDKQTDESYLTIAIGRDWSDCPVERGTFIGNADQTQTVFMRVEEQ